MFGCYRRGEANDPDTYVAAITMVLTRYSAEVVEAVTDPFAGLPSRKKENGYTGMPDVADVKEACENEAARQLRFAKYHAMGRTEFKRLPSPPNNRPGSRANVFVPGTDPRFQAFVTRAETGDKRDWRYEENRHGIWVSLVWIEEGVANKSLFRQFSDEDLRRMYPVRKAEDVAHETSASAETAMTAPKEKTSALSRETESAA